MTIDQIVQVVVKDNPNATINYLVGEVYKLSKGKPAPNIVRGLIEEELKS